MSKIYNVLILCTGNSARSVIAEVLFNNLAITMHKFTAYSAGSCPKGRVNPFALELLSQSGFPTQDIRSKSWDEFFTAGSPIMDFVITVCDEAAGEHCPIWPGKPIVAHWGIPDPAAVAGADEEKRKAFKDTLLGLTRRIELFASLPLEKLERLELENHMAVIGKQ